LPNRRPCLPNWENAMSLSDGETPQSFRSLADLSPQDVAEVFAELCQKQQGQTRDGKPYYRVGFRDRRRTVTSMIWFDSGWYEDCDANWQPGQFYRLRGRYYENQYGAQFELEALRPVNEADVAKGFDPAEFQLAIHPDPFEVLAQLREHATNKITDLPLRQLVLELLDDHSEELPAMAAAKWHHHAYRGGFLEHLLSVTETAIYLVEKYRDQYAELDPPLSVSLVVAGAILHDIGKLRELHTQVVPTDYTPAGRLIGHILLGRDMVREKAAQIPDFDAEILLRLEHIIVSHQGTPAWGSPIPPSTPEALLIHYADDLDAKFQMMAAALLAPPLAGQEEFTSTENPLRRRIFRGLHLPAE